MAPNKPQDYLNRFQKEVITFTPFTCRKMGLLQGSTFVKIDDFMLICTPYQMSMQRGILLAVLSPQESVYFRKYQNSLCSLNFSFHPGDKRMPVKLFIRAVIQRLGPMKDRQNVCLIDLAFKNVPNDFVEFFGDYVAQFEALKTQYEALRTHRIKNTPQNAKLLKYNNTTEVFFQKHKVKVILLELSVGDLVLAVPDQLIGLKEELELGVKLYFQSGQFSLNGKIRKILPMQEGFHRVELGIPFYPELVELVDHFVFRARIQGFA